MYFGFSGDVHAAPDLHRLEKLLKSSFLELQEATQVKPPKKKKAKARAKARGASKPMPGPAARVTVPIPAPAPAPPAATAGKPVTRAEEGKGSTQLIA
jgi:hypothetical protein